jgi:hypothetical protein
VLQADIHERPIREQTVRLRKFLLNQLETILDLLLAAVLDRGVGHGPQKCHVKR